MQKAHHEYVGKDHLVQDSTPPRHVCPSRQVSDPVLYSLLTKLCDRLGGKIGTVALHMGNGE